MKFEKTTRFFALTIGIVLSVFLVIGVVSAATTISTNITTGGTLSVTGLSTLSGQLQASSTALFGGATTFYANLTVDKAATTTVTFNQAGINFDSNTFVIDPNANRVGVLIAAPNTTFEVVGTASTTNLVVGGNGTSLGGIVTGTCAVDPDNTAIATSSIVSTSCSATGVRSGDSVFMTPPSDSISDYIVFAGATASTTNGFISVKVYNASTTSAVNAPSRTWIWMAIR